MRVLVIHGPNLNLLGEREPAVYGTATLEEIDRALRELAEHLGVEVGCVQHNGEGEIIETLHGARGVYDAIVLNPGAYAHYSHAIADAIAAIGIPTIEVHLSNTAAREAFRHHSVTARACRGIIAGFGGASYLLALRALAENLAR